MTTTMLERGPELSGKQPEQARGHTAIDTEGTVTYELRAGVAWLGLNRPCAHHGAQFTHRCRASPDTRCCHFLPPFVSDAEYCGQRARAEYDYIFES
jgi:hypothetical protein